MLKVIRLLLWVIVVEVRHGVPGVIVPRGERGVFEAYALKWASPRTGWKVVSYLKGTQVVEFPL